MSIVNDGNAVEKTPKPAPRHICICICTFKRPAYLGRLLKSLERQETHGLFTYSAVVCDNDVEKSSESIVTDFMNRSDVKIAYCVEPCQNIALARNRALNSAHGDFIAFIDDDEFPEPLWLAMMLNTCEQYKAAGVLGPVRPHFEETPPQWIIKGRFCDRPEHPTGHVMDWEESRTGNLLFRHNILDGLAEVFDPAFGNGGEDKDFFMRMIQKGHQFLWCNVGIVYETVPPERWTRSYMLKRALLRGKNILKHPSGKIGLLLRSFIAAPAYLLMLPFTLLIGQHVFMKYSIKLCDHAGRILALFGLNPVTDR